MIILSPSLSPLSLFNTQITSKSHTTFYFVLVLFYYCFPWKFSSHHSFHFYAFLSHHIYFLCNQLKQTCGLLEVSYLLFLSRHLRWHYVHMHMCMRQYPHALFLWILFLRSLNKSLSILLLNFYC